MDEVECSKHTMMSSSFFKNNEEHIVPVTWDNIGQWGNFGHISIQLIPGFSYYQWN